MTALPPLNCTVRSIAFRYNQGPSGGPGGSNALMEIANQTYSTLGQAAFFYRQALCGRFWSSCLGRQFLRALPGRIKTHLELADFIRRSTHKAGANTLYIAHDIKSAAALARRQKPYLISYHQQGSAVAEKRSFGLKTHPGQDKKLIQLEQVCFSQANGIVFTSTGSLDAYLETCSVTEDLKNHIRSQARIVYNSCCQFSPRPPSEYAQLIEPRLKHQSRRLILTVSSLTAFKGVDQIPAFLDHLANFRDTCLWILCGEGHLDAQIHEQLRERHLEDHLIHIRRRMPQEELAYLYQQATFYLMMHRYSIFDLATLEAMAAGCIPLLSAVGGNLEQNKDHNVIFVEGLDRLPDDANELTRLATRNQHVFSHHFNQQNLLEGYRRVIEESAPCH